jgi:hypothetical protein
MMVDSLVAMYEKGAITADHLIVQCLSMIDPADPALVLNVLPEKILSRMLEFVGKYQPDRMVSSYGPLPVVDQVEAAKSWIEGASKITSALPSRV